MPIGSPFFIRGVESRSRLMHHYRTIFVEPCRPWPAIAPHAKRGGQRPGLLGGLSRGARHHFRHTNAPDCLPMKLAKIRLAGGEPRIAAHAEAGRSLRLL